MFTANYNNKLLLYYYQYRNYYFFLINTNLFLNKCIGIDLINKIYKKKLKFLN
jgi:hypothetical protein